MKTGETMLTERRNEKGFTVLELAIVLIIFGIIASTVFVALNFYSQEQRRVRTSESLDTLQTALALHEIFGCLPCPARLSADPGDMDYGREQRAGEPIPCMGACDPTSLTVVPAEDETGTIIVGENILIGAFPFQTLLDNNVMEKDSYSNYIGGAVKRLSGRASMDGWKRKITYAVPERLTTLTNYTPQGGLIRVLDENDESVLERDGSGKYVLISHGPNGRGAYTEDGHELDDCVMSACFPLPAPCPGVKNRNENENCDNNDGVFLAGLKSDADPGYDDIIRYVAGTPPNLWENSGKDDRGTPNPADDIQYITNTNPGKVGMGVVSPDQRLHVDGEIQAQDILSRKLCSLTPDGNPLEDCMPPDVIGGEVANMKCPAGQVVVSIEQNKVNCASPFAGITLSDCPSGSFMAGISSKNGIICYTP
ncbi:MAG: type II secretion system protein [Alphaproteobacteria bacterium]|nr:type II secretion system protein [Alphaproteobacteria bacterium]